MCETRRSDKAPSEREDASSTAVQPGSPCDAHGTIQLQTPQTRSRPKRDRDPLSLGHRRESSSEWLPDLSIDPNLPLTPISGLKRSWEDIIADDSPAEPDKLACSLNDMLEEEVKVRKRRKLAQRPKKLVDATDTALQFNSSDRHGTTQQQQQPPAGREMNGPHTRQPRNP